MWISGICYGVMLQRLGLLPGVIYIIESNTSVCLMLGEGYNSWFRIVLSSGWCGLDVVVVVFGICFQVVGSYLIYTIIIIF